jgi:large subunit ribosomal protein L9
MIEVILSQDVDTLGKAGTIVKVKDGFARNFLLPQKKAYAATPANIRRIEQEKQKRTAEEKKAIQEMEALAEKLAKASFTVPVEVNDLEKLYGSVTDLEISKVLQAEGYEIEKKAILLEKPIEELGIYEIPIKLHHDVTAKIRLWVTKK